MYFILRLPYTIVLYYLTFISKVFWNYIVWPRHSYLRKSFQPLFSDLDLSIHISNPYRIKSFLRFYSFNKFFFPFLGELYIYDSNVISYLKKYPMNGFEISRDPLFIKKFSLNLNTSEYFTKFYAISFLFRNMLIDLYKIKKNPTSRIKKWKDHFSEVELNLNYYSSTPVKLQLNEEFLLRSILSQITNLYQCSSIDEAELIRSYLKIFTDICLESKKDSDFSSWLLPLLNKPLEYEILNSFFILYTCFLRDPKLHLNLKSQSVLISQIDSILLHKIRSFRSMTDLQTPLQTLENLEFICKQQISNPELFHTSLKIRAAIDLIKNFAPPNASSH